jgi:hypothetical protein
MKKLSACVLDTKPTLSYSRILKWQPSACRHASLLKMVPARKQSSLVMWDILMLSFSSSSMCVCVRVRVFVCVCVWGGVFTYNLSFSFFHKNHRDLNMGIIQATTLYSPTITKHLIISFTEWLAVYTVALSCMKFTKSSLSSVCWRTEATLNWHTAQNF